MVSIKVTSTPAQTLSDSLSKTLPTALSLEKDETEVSPVINRRLRNIQSPSIRNRKLRTVEKRIFETEPPQVPAAILNPFQKQFDQMSQLTSPKATSAADNFFLSPRYMADFSKATSPQQPQKFKKGEAVKKKFVSKTRNRGAPVKGQLFLTSQQIQKQTDHIQPTSMMVAAKYPSAKKRNNYVGTTVSKLLENDDPAQPEQPPNNTSKQSVIQNTYGKLLQSELSKTSAYAVNSRAASPKGGRKTSEQVHSSSVKVVKRKRSMELGRKPPPLRISKDAIIVESSGNFSQHHAFPFSANSSNMKGRLSTPKAYASVLSNTFGNYEGLSEQLYSTRKNALVCTPSQQQQTGKLQQNSYIFSPTAKLTSNRKIKDKEEVRKFLAKFF